jgi:hypothetical protein
MDVQSLSDLPVVARLEVKPRWLALRPLYCPSTVGGKPAAAEGQINDGGYDKAYIVRDITQPGMGTGDRPGVNALVEKGHRDQNADQPGP